MPADPGAGLKNAPKTTATTPADIGHVAPGFEKEHVVYNTLVVRPEYRISLHLGEIERLFPDPPDSKKGRMARLQVLGFFYFPLSHARAQTAFDGEVGVMGVWEYFKKKVLNNADDAAADAEIQERLKRWVVQRLNGKEAESCYTGAGTPGGGEFPLPAPTNDKGDPVPDVAKGHFGKLRVPGGYGYIYDYAPVNFNHDANYPLPMDPDNAYKAQEWCCQDNPVLGAIPLIAKVEKRDPASGEWKPAPNVHVYFQLVMPYNLSAFDAAVSPSAQVNRPTMRASNMQTNTNTGVGPAKQDERARTYMAAAADDPQADNCHKDFGGQRGQSVDGHVFEIDMENTSHKDRVAGTAVAKVDRPGFHAEHSDPIRKLDITAPFFEKPKKAPVSDHPWAVRTKTHVGGEAGVIFKPSLVGGDRYRLKAYIGPDSLTGPGSDGNGMTAVAVETGTLVVWRNVRISQLLRKPYSTIAAAVTNGITTHWNGVANTDPEIRRPAEYLKYSVGMATQDHVGNFMKAAQYDDGWGITDAGYAKLDFSRGRATDDTGTSYAYDGFILGVARSFCEVDFDGQGGNWFANPPEPTEDWEAKWNSAVTSIKTFLKAAAANRRVRYETTGGAFLTVEIDVDQLFDSTLTFSNCYAMLPFKMPGVYNAAVPNNKKVPLDANGWYFASAKAKSAFNSWLGVKVIRPFMSYLANRGFTPGFSIVQMPKSSVWHMGLLGDASIGMGFRCCVLILGKDEYPTTTRQSKDGTGKLVLKRAKNTAATLSDISYSSLALHELGHCLFHVHAPPDPVNDADSAKVHDVEGDGYCVMTYLPCEGDFCGRCALTLRGWKDIRNIPTP